MAEHMTPVVAKVLPEEKAAFAAAPSRSTSRPTGPLAKTVPNGWSLKNVPND